MRTWEVLALGLAEIHKVQANSLRVESGCLVFYVQDGEMRQVPVRVYAPGTWREVVLDTGEAIP